MDAYIVDWLNILARWLHFISGIAWIGSSFYFVWLDNHLQAVGDPSDAAKGVGGELWSVHGGGFYHAQKYSVAPPELPGTLHWFKWEAYTTWMSGMFLLALIYWYGAEVYLIDPAVADLSSTAAIGVAVAVLAGGWIVYDLLCRSPLGKDQVTLGSVLFVLFGILAWGLCQLYSGRGAYIHFGAVLGTIMVANVFFVIIPGQRQLVDAVSRGEHPDPGPGVRAKQRSVHNTYFTLPVLFVMISNHYAMTYGHDYNWLILIAISLAGALIRAYFVARHKGKASPVTVIAAVLMLLAVAAAIVPKSRATAGGQAVDFNRVRSVILERCATCHSAAPTHFAFPAAPGGVILDSDDQIVEDAFRIHQQTVVTRVMPIGNLTRMTDEERAIIDRWYQSGGTAE
ncbi:MAG: urate hydroxylase PuuD [Woeseia sp.]